jgi:hypothetical protein
MIIKNVFLILILFCSISINSKYLKLPQRDLNCQAVPVYVEQEECEDEASPFLVQNETQGDKALFVSQDFFKDNIQPKLECNYQPKNEETEEDREEFARELAKFESDELLLGNGDMIGGSGAEGLDRDHIDVRRAEIDGFVDNLDSDDKQEAYLDDGSLVVDSHTKVVSGNNRLDGDNLDVWSPEERIDNVGEDDYQHQDPEVPLTASGDIDYDALLDESAII